MSDRVTAAAIKAGMTRVFGGNEYALLFEVGNGVGFSKNRAADAIVMSCWPSRGLHLTGYEIKVSRSDWLNERKQPEKAESIAAYCEFWVLLTAPGVVKDVIEIPEGWGWVVFDGKNFKTMKPAARKECQACDRNFLAALLRRASRNDEAIVSALVADAERRAYENVEERIKGRAEMETRHLREDLHRLSERVREFEAESGINLSDRWTSGKELGKAVAAVRSAGIFNTYDGLNNLAQRLRESAAKIDNAVASMKPSPGGEDEVRDRAASADGGAEAD